MNVEQMQQSELIKCFRIMQQSELIKSLHRMQQSELIEHSKISWMIETCKEFLIWKNTCNINHEQKKMFGVFKSISKTNYNVKL